MSNNESQRMLLIDPSFLLIMYTSCLNGPGNRDLTPEISREAYHEFQLVQSGCATGTHEDLLECALGEINEQFPILASEESIQALGFNLL
jgi:hypothetical protein